MVLYLKLDQEIWNQGDFTADNTLALTGTIYSDNTFATAFDLTGYTLEIELYDQNRSAIFTDDADIVTAADGTFRYKPSIGELNIDFIGEVKIKLSKTDTEVTAEGRNGSGKLRIRE